MPSSRRLAQRMAVPMRRMVAVAAARSSSGTGTTNARFFSVTFVCINGTVWQEVARTAAQT